MRLPPERPGCPNQGLAQPLSPDELPRGCRRLLPATPHFPTRLQPSLYGRPEQRNPLNVGSAPSRSPDGRHTPRYWWRVKVLRFPRRAAPHTTSAVPPWSAHPQRGRQERNAYYALRDCPVFGPAPPESAAGRPEIAALQASRRRG